MAWPTEIEKNWRLLIDELADASQGFFLIEYDRSFTREAIIRRLQAEFEQRGWSLSKLDLQNGQLTTRLTARLEARLEAALRDWPIKAALLCLDDAGPDQLRALNLDRDRLYDLPVVLIFLTSREAYTQLLHSAHDLTTWIAPPFRFALPESGIPSLPPPADSVTAERAAQMQYYREQVLQALDNGARSRAFERLPALADLYLGAGMYDAAAQTYHALARYHETAAHERQAILFTRRRDTARSWRILDDVQTGYLASDDRAALQRALDEGLLTVQKSAPGRAASIVDEMGYSRSVPPDLLVTLKALSDQVAFGDWDPIQLRQTLTSRFDREELRTLCFDLGVDYEALPAEGKAGKARELVNYMERRERLADLVETIRRMRPDIPLPGGDEMGERERPGLHRERAQASQRHGLQRALDMARRNLAILEEQTAGYTALTIPAHLRIQLEDKRREVEDLARRLAD